MKGRVLVIALACISIATDAQWSLLGNGLNAGVRALLYDSLEQRLYTFGAFTQADGVLVNGTAWWDGVSWHPMGNGVQQPSMPVIAAVKKGNELVIGGLFQSADSEPNTFGLARWLGQNWETVCAEGGGAINLRYIDDSLFVCGYGEFCGITAEGIAFRHNEEWHPVLQPGLLAPWPVVSCVERYHGELYIGGTFVASNGIEDFGRVFDDSLFDVGVNGDSWVNDMVVYNGLLYVGGYFYANAGNAADMLMCWDGSQWFNPFPQVRFGTQIRDLLVEDGVLYISGPVTPWGESGHYSLCRYDGEELCLIGGKGYYSGSIAVGGNTLYAGVGVDLLGPDSLDANWIAQLDLTYPSDTCFSVVQGMTAKEAMTPSLDVFPNPVEDRITFVLPIVLQNKHLRVQVFSALGREVLATQLSSGASSINVGTLPRGYYTGWVNGANSRHRFNFVRR